MIFRIIRTLFFCLLFYQAFTQPQTEPFQLSLQEIKVPGSLYNSIKLVDLRTDTTQLGWAQKGAFNKLVNVIPATPLSEQFNQLITSMVDSSAGHGELILLLRQFRFVEITKAMSEFGYCHLRAVLFANSMHGPSKLETLDTVVLIRAMDVTKKMFREGSKAITTFISNNLTKLPDQDFRLTISQLPLIDSFEKTRIPLYANPVLNDGIYYSYSSFADQQPDETGLSVLYDKKGRVLRISYINKKGEKWNIENRFIYAFVHQGKPYISGEFTCYPLEKRSDDFYFTGKVNNAKNTDIAAATYFFGIIGALFASSATAVLEMKIDHLTGGFIPITPTRTSLKTKKPPNKSGGFI